jgi:hypothetical protein
MRQLSPAGQQAVNDLAERHGFSADAVVVMLDAVMKGNGAMAQFSHPEFGGSGQWMGGGMTMVGDMFNHGLRARVDILCSDLATLIAAQPNLVQTGSFQSQNQRGTVGNEQQSNTDYAGPVSLFVAASEGSPAGNWWPQDLGWPSSTGAQNDVRYAYFPEPRRLAIEAHGVVTIYDTLDHTISGFAQQGAGGSLTFSSRHRIVSVASLPVVSGSGISVANDAPAVRPPGAAGAEILAAIERLAELRDRGIVSDSELDAKKTELLNRL